jgi:tricorn protease-like protein
VRELALTIHALKGAAKQRHPNQHSKSLVQYSKFFFAAYRNSPPPNSPIPYIVFPIKITLMRKLLFISMACIAGLCAKAQSSEAYFLSAPCLTPDGQTVVFSFEGDLWKAPVANGVAVRLTAMQGYENNAKISPDGKWVAFTGRQMGNADVYIMPLAGGDIKQLTFHSAGDDMNSWSWDSKKIYFTSTRAGSSRVIQ